MNVYYFEVSGDKGIVFAENDFEAKFKVGDYYRIESVGDDVEVLAFL